MTRAGGSRAWCAVSLALAALGAAGCATERRIDDGQIINGVKGEATATPVEVAGLAESELVAVYEGENVKLAEVARPDQQAVIAFFHRAPAKEQGGGSSGCGLGACIPCGSSGPCQDPPKLSLVKLADYRGFIAGKVEIDLTDIPTAERDHIPVAYHLELSNTGCSKATRILLVDALPAGFTPSGVSLEDLHAPDGNQIALALIPPFAGAILLAARHSANMKFDDVAWDVKQVGAKQILVVSIAAETRPVAPGDYLDLKIAGIVAAPAEKP